VFLTPYTTLAVNTKAEKAISVLDVACGAGMHELYFAKSFMKRGCTLVCTDTSDNMLKLTHMKFTDKANNYITVPENKFHANLDY